MAMAMRIQNHLHAASHRKSVGPILYSQMYVRLNFTVRCLDSICEQETIDEARSSQCGWRQKKMFRFSANSRIQGIHLVPVDNLAFSARTQFHSDDQNLLIGLRLRRLRRSYLEHTNYGKHCPLTVQYDTVATVPQFHRGSVVVPLQLQQRS